MNNSQELVSGTMAFVALVVSARSLLEKFKNLQREWLIVRARNAIQTQNIQRLEECELELLEIVASEMEEFLEGRVQPITFDIVEVLSDVYDSLISLKKSTAVQSNPRYSVFVGTYFSYADDLEYCLDVERIPALFNTEEDSSLPVMWNDMITSDVALFIIDETFLTSSWCLRGLLVFMAKERVRAKVGEPILKQSHMVLVIPDREIIDIIQRSPIGPAVSLTPLILARGNKQSILNHVLFDVLPVIRALIRPAKSLLASQNAMFVDEELKISIAKCLQYQASTRDEEVIERMIQPAQGI